MRGQLLVALLCVLVLTFTAACGGGDDDDGEGADEAPTTTSAATAPAAVSELSPTTSDEATATATETVSEPTATATTAAATATEADEPTATTASDPTSTTSADVSTPTDEEFEDFETLDPEALPNFSLRMSYIATNLAETPQTTVTFQIEQNAVDNYHINMDADGEVLEMWTVGGRSWISESGEVIESPSGPLFRPSDLLSTTEVLPEELDAEREGEEEVNGRETTKWVVDAEDYVEMAQEDGSIPSGATDAAGEMAVWIDNELNIMIKSEADVTWTNADGTDGSLLYDYEIYDIGSTDEVQSPQ